MRKAICPQPIKRIYFYNRREEIINKFKNFCKIISFLVTIFLISGLPVQAFGDTISSGFPSCTSFPPFKIAIRSPNFNASSKS